MTWILIELTENWVIYCCRRMKSQRRIPYRSWNGCRVEATAWNRGDPYRPILRTRSWNARAKRGQRWTPTALRAGPRRGPFSRRRDRRTAILVAILGPFSRRNAAPMTSTKPTPIDPDRSWKAVPGRSFFFLNQMRIHSLHSFTIKSINSLNSIQIKWISSFDSFKIKWIIKFINSLNLIKIKWISSFDSFKIEFIHN